MSPWHFQPPFLIFAAGAKIIKIEISAEYEQNMEEKRKSKDLPTDGNMMQLAKKMIKQQRKRHVELLRTLPLSAKRLRAVFAW